MDDGLPLCTRRPPLVSSTSSNGGLDPGATSTGVFFLGAACSRRRMIRPPPPSPTKVRDARRRSRPDTRAGRAHAQRQGRPHRLGLPAQDPLGPGVRRGPRVGAAAGAQPVATAGQPRAAQARGPAGRVQLQAARRLQQDGAPAAGPAQAGRDLRLGRQPRPGRGAGRAQAGLPGGDRDARDHPPREGRRRADAGRRGGAAR